MLHINTRQAEYDAIIEQGNRLVNTPASQGGYAEYFTKDPVSGIDESMSDRPILRAQTAVLMENVARYMAVACGAPLSKDGKSRILAETTTSAVLGGFADYMLPAVRMSVPTNILTDIASLQPTTRKVATITYLHTVVGRTRGSRIQGTRLNDALTGYTQTADDFTSQDINNEAVTIAVSSAGSTSTATGTLTYASGGGLIPGSVQVVVPTSNSTGGALFNDDGRGGWISLTQAATNVLSGSNNTINYFNGAFSITLIYSSSTFTGTSAVASYSFDQEGSPDTPQIDFQPEIDSVKTGTRKVRTNVTREGEFDMQMEVGESAMALLAEQVVGQLNSDVSREGIRRMWEAAGTPFISFAVSTLPSGVSRQEYLDGFMYALELTSNRIHQQTQRGWGNFLICDATSAAAIASMSKFEAAETPDNVNGVFYIGKLANQYAVYKDIRLVNLPGASSYGNILMGFKGKRWIDSGLVYAPYQVLIMTNPLETADFVTQRGFATRYAMKMVSSLMYLRITFSN